LPPDDELQTKLKRLETLLAETEALSQMGSWDWEVKTDRLHWTRGLHLVYGIPDTPVTCLGDYLAIMTPERRETFMRILDKALADHQPYVFETWIERPNGEKRLVRGNGRVVVGADGQPEHVLGTLQDLTEEHLAAEALAASEAKLRAIVDASPDLVLIRDFDGNYVMFNDPVVTSLGVAREQLQGRNIRDVFDERTVAQVEASDREVLARNAAIRTELYATTKAGKQIILEATKYPYVLPNGQPAGIISISRDVTELRALEGLLHRRNEEFKAFVESSPDVIARVDREHHLVYLNPGNDDQGRMVGRRLSDVGLAEPEARSFAQAVDHVFATGEQVQREVGYLMPEGQRWYQARLFPERAKDGTIQHVLVTARDVTEGRRAMEQLEGQKALLERIVGFAPFGVAYLDRDLVYRWLNDSYARLFDRPASEFQDRFIGDVFPNMARPEPRFQHVLETGIPFTATSYPAVVRAGDDFKQSFWDLAYVPIPDGSGRVEGILVIAQEVSTRVESERLRAEQLKRLQQLDEFRRVLVSAVSHELRTPLTSVVGYAEFLEDEIAGSLNREQRTFLDAIKGGVFRLRRIVDDLLDIDRLENGSFKLDQQPLDFRLELEDTLRELRPQIEAADIMVHVDVPDAPLVAEIDSARVGQVLVNLISNALKFTPPHGRISVVVQRQEGQLVCRIADNGAGIRPEDLPKLFQRFAQLDEGARKGGTGLGLFISKALVEAHGGSIGVESTPGAGSTFWFTLPLVGAPHPAQRISGS
jgi:PAS domain S-box-containing protein